MIRKVTTPVGTYSVRQITTFVKERKTLVCLHGFMGTSQSFEFLNKQDDFNVVAIDLIGHGASQLSLNPNDYSLESISLALKIIIDTLELPFIYLFGYSFGGRVALTFAHHYPHHVKHLFLESSSFGLKTENEKNERQLKDNQLAQKLLEIGMSSFVDKWQELPLFSSQKYLSTEIFEREISQKKMQSEKTMSLALQYGSVATQVNFLTSESIKQLQITYLAGSLDQKYAKIGQELAKKIDINCIIVENVGHCIHLEEPDFVQDILYAVMFDQIVEIKSVNSKEYELELVSPFKTSYGELNQKKTDILIVKATNGFEGYGELLSFEAPDYIEETLQGDRYIIKNDLIPLLKNKKIYSPRQIRDLFQSVRGNQMAKSAIETAVWDLFSKMKKVSLSQYLSLPSDKVAVGVSIGIQESEIELLKVVRGYVEEGYKRIKIKIMKGKDFSYIKAIREEFPDLILMIDANSAYHISDINYLKKLDRFNLELIEQPLGANDFIEHASLQKDLRTAICLDENIRSLGDVKLAHTIGSCKSINLKIPRVGGLREALDILQYAKQENISIWLGGMLESGVGRSLNIILANHPVFTLPGDISASSRYYQEDTIKEEFLLDQGMMLPIDKCGIGVTLKNTEVNSISYL